MNDSIFELSSIDGSNGFIINGIDKFDLSGISVSDAGDVNGDGIDDLIIGSAAGDPNGDASGESYVVFGKKDGFDKYLELNSLNGTNGFIINGIDAKDSSGRSVSSAGDINADGIDDLIVGAYLADPNGDESGESYVVFGSKDGFNSTLELSSLDGSNGFVLNGTNTADYSGFSTSKAGDINADGIDDLIIGAYRASSDSGDFGGNVEAGESYVVFGSKDGFNSTLELSSLNGSNGFTIGGIKSQDYLGYSVSEAGDINNDDIDDLIVGAYLADSSGNAVGESYIIFGKSDEFNSYLDLDSLDGNNGFVINGINDFDYSGFSVSDAGDVNHDGIDDVIIGAYFADPNDKSKAGESYVVFGSDEGFDSSIELSSLDGTNGFAIRGAKTGDYSGASVSGAGDVNNDGIDDVIIGAYFADPNGKSQAGETYVVYGSDKDFADVLELSDLNGTNGYIINGIDIQDHSGISVSDAGDINGDGVDDIIIGATKGDSNQIIRDAGESFVVFGKAGNQNLVGTDEDDILIGGEGDDTLNGLDKNDYLEGQAGNDYLWTGNGNDVAAGQGGNDELIGHGGHDTLLGGNGNDTLRGGHGQDSLLGRGDNDIIHGDYGNDTLRGGEGKDILKGGDHNDILLGNNGDDTLHGGRGQDIFFFKGHDYGTDTIQDFHIGEDRIALGSGYSFAGIEISGEGDAMISHNQTTIAILQNVSPDELGAKDFLDL